MFVKPDVDSECFFIFRIFVSVTLFCGVYCHLGFQLVISGMVVMGE